MRPITYKHYKGALYTLLFVAWDSTNGREGRELAVYVSHATGLVRARELTEFNEIVEWPDGFGRPRFVVWSGPA